MTQHKPGRRGVIFYLFFLIKTCLALGNNVLSTHVIIMDEKYIS